MPASSTRLGRANQPPPAPNSLQMRCKRFRVKAGCLSWLPREGTNHLRIHLENLLGPLCVSQNSSRSFGRDLTRAEQDAWLGVNKGSKPERRRRSNRTPEPREESDEEDEDDEDLGDAVEDEDLAIKEEPADTDWLPSNPSPRPKKVARKPKSTLPQPVVSHSFLSLPPASSAALAVKSQAKRRRLPGSESDNDDGPISRRPRASRHPRASPQEPEKRVAPFTAPLVHLDREPGSRSAQRMWSRIFTSQQTPDDEAAE